MIGKRCRSRVAMSVAVFAAAATGALSFTAVAGATTYTAVDTPSLVTAVASANANTTSPSTITIAPGTYSPTATLAITNTTEPVTFQGPTPVPNVVGTQADIGGASIVPSFGSVLSIASGSTVNLDNIVISSAGGSTAGAISDSGTLNSSGLTLQGNNGALAIQPGATSTLTNSTVADAINSGIIDAGTLTLINSDVINSGQLGISNTGHTLNLENSIVADSTTKDCSAAATTSVTSIDGDGTCGVGALSSEDGTLNFTSSVATLTNGGATPTYAPGKTSPAIGAATEADCPSTDQRGFTRPATGCDIGAVQTSIAGPTLTSPTGTLTVTGSAPTAVTFTQSWLGSGFPVKASTEVCSPVSGSTFSNTAPTPVNCTASDYYGNGGTGTFQVVIAAATAPTVTITPTTGTVTGSGPTLTTTVSDTTSAAGSNVSWTDASQDATDGTSDAVTCSDAGGPVVSGAKFPIGSTTVTCSATDSNHLTGSATLIIVVKDASPPVVTGSSNITENLAAGTSTSVTYSPAPSATDLVDGTDAVTCTIPAVPPATGTTPAPSGTTFTAPATAGQSTTTTVTCAATDTQGLSGSATFTVTVNAVSPTAGSQNGLIQGTVNAVETLTPLPTCNLGIFTPGFAFTYTCSTTTDATSTYAKAYVTVQDVTPGDTTGEHLINATKSLASPFTIAGVSAVATEAPATTVVTAPTLLLSYGVPVSNDPVTLNVSQPISGTEPLTAGTYAATVQLTISQTP